MGGPFWTPAAKGLGRRSPLLRYDLQPVAVRVLDEVDPHRRVLVADAAHLLVAAVRAHEVLRGEGEMELVVPEEDQGEALVSFC